MTNSPSLSFARYAKMILLSIPMYSLVACSDEAAIASMLLAPCTPAKTLIGLDLLSNHPLDSLTYFAEKKYSFMDGEGYYIWSDNKYEYESAILYHYAPSDHGGAVAKHCQTGVSLQQRLPLGSEEKAKTNQFLYVLNKYFEFDPDIVGQQISRVANGINYSSASIDGALHEFVVTKIKHSARGDLITVRISF